MRESFWICDHLDAEYLELVFYKIQGKNKMLGQIIIRVKPTINQDGLTLIQFQPKITT